jgi:hypothetical protein
MPTTTLKKKKMLRAVIYGLLRKYENNLYIVVKTLKFIHLFISIIQLYFYIFDLVN